MMYEYDAMVLDVIDGDTLKLRVDVGLDTERILRRARLAYINTPEDYDGEAATAFVVSWLQSHTIGNRVRVKTLKNKTNSLELLEKWGRYLVIVYSPAVIQGGEPVCLNDELIATGFAVRYGLR